MENKKKIPCQYEDVIDIMHVLETAAIDISILTVLQKDEKKNELLQAAEKEISSAYSKLALVFDEARYAKEEQGNEPEGIQR